MEQASALAHPAAWAPFRGELRRLPPTAALRALQALTLFTLFRSLARATFRYTLGHRHRFTLHPTGRQLVLERDRILLGRVIRRARTVLPIEQLQEITLERAGEPAAFTAGLAALAGGTFVGTRFISEGLLASSVAPWLLGGGSLLILGGVLLDFFVGSGRTPSRSSGRPELILRSSSERGWILTGFDEPRAEALLSAVEQALATGEQLPDSLAHSDPSESPAPPIPPNPELPVTESNAPPG